MSDDYVSPPPKKTYELLAMSQETLNHKIEEATNPLHNKIIHLETQLKQAQEAIEAARLEIYLIWSNEHNAWWRPNRNSYTTDISKAGRYSLEMAIEICNGANYGWDTDREIPNELPILERTALQLRGPRDY